MHPSTACMVGSTRGQSAPTIRPGLRCALTASSTDGTGLREGRRHWGRGALHLTSTSDLSSRRRSSHALHECFPPDSLPQLPQQPPLTTPGRPEQRSVQKRRRRLEQGPSLPSKRRTLAAGHEHPVLTDSSRQRAVSRPSPPRHPVTILATILQSPYLPPPPLSWPPPPNLR